MTDFGGSGDAEYFIPIRADGTHFPREVQEIVERSITGLRVPKIRVASSDIAQDVSKQIKAQFDALEITLPIDKLDEASLQAAANRALSNFRPTATFNIAEGLQLPPGLAEKLALANTLRENEIAAQQATVAFNNYGISLGDKVATASRLAAREMGIVSVTGKEIGAEFRRAQVASDQFVGAYMAAANATRVNDAANQSIVRSMAAIRSTYSGTQEEVNSFQEAWLRAANAGRVNDAANQSVVRSMAQVRASYAGTRDEIENYHNIWLKVATAASVNDVAQQKILQGTAEIRASYSGVSRDVENLSTAWLEGGSAAAAQEKAMLRARAALDPWAGAMEAMEATQEQATRGLKALTAAEDEARNAFAKAGIAIPAGSDPQQIIQAAHAIDQASDAGLRSVHVFDQNVKISRQVTSAFTNVGRAANNIGDAFGNAFQSGAVLERALSTLGVDTLPIIGPAFIRVVGTMQSFNRLLELGNPRINRLATQLNLTGVKAGVLAAGVQAFVGAMIIGVREASKAEEELAQIEQAIISTGRQGTVSAEQIDQFARSMEKFGAFSRVAILEAADAAVTFTEIKDVTALLAVGMDVAAREGTGLVDTINRIGKVIQDPSRATTLLGSAIRGLTTAERARIKTLQEQGQFSEAARVVIERLRITSEGAAAVQRETLAGAFAALKNEVMTFLADGANPLIRALIFLVDLTRNFVTGVRQVAEWVGKIPPPFIALGAAVGIVFALSKAITVLTASTAGFMAIVTRGKSLKDLALGAVAAGLVLAGLGKIVNDAEKKAKESSSGFDDLSNAVDESKDVSLEAADGFRILGIEASQLDFSYLELKDAVEKYHDEQEKVTKLEEDRVKLLETQSDAVINTKRAYAELAATVAATSAVQEKSNEVVEDYTAAQRAHEAALRDSEIAARDVDRAEEDLLETREDTIAVTEGYLRLLEETTLAENERLEAEGKVLDAQLELNDAYRKTRSSVLDLEEALLDLTDAQIAEERATFIANRTLQVFGANSSQYRHALEEEKRAKIATERQSMRVADAQDSILEANQEYREQVFETNAVLHGYAENTDEARNATRQLQDAQIEAVGVSIAYQSAQQRLRDTTYELRYQEELLNQQRLGNLPLSDKVTAKTEDLNDAKDREREITADLAENWEKIADQMERVDRIEAALLSRTALAEAAGLRPVGGAQGTFGSDVVPGGAYSRENPLPVAVVNAAQMAQLIGGEINSGGSGDAASGGQITGLPKMALGGIVPGAYNQPRLIIAHGGERVIPTGVSEQSHSASGGNFIMSAIARLHDAIRQLAIAQARASTGRDGRPVAAVVQLDGMTLAQSLIPYMRVVQTTAGQGSIPS